MEINLKLNKSLFSSKFYPYLFDYSNRFEVYMGSAGSGKSYFITQKLILRALQEPIRILVCRRYGTTLRNSVFSLFKEILTNWQIIEYMKVNESDFRIRFPNGSEIIFTGLDDETKLLSLNNIGTIWVEEAYEVPRAIVEQLNLRMRGKNDNQQIILSFNPISKSGSWLYEFCEEKPPQSFLYLRSTFRDNPFLSKDYVASLEELYKTNPQKARIYCDGEWGVDAEGLVFTNWKVEEFDATALAKQLEHRCGMDFGYKDASAIVETFYDAANRTIYISQEFYKTGQTLEELLTAIRNLELLRAKIQCDAAEPRTIDYFRRNNINAVPCIKGQNSVFARISFLQNHKLVVHPQCANVIRELENFSYEKDKQTGNYTNKTTHEFSHSIDALGYAYSDIYTKSKLRTIDKSVLGL